MADRATRGGGRSLALTGAAALAPYGSGGGADWFGPSKPMPPLAPPEVAGRSWDFPPNYNLNVTARPYSLIKFPMMMALADSYDLLRLVIETRKDQMAGQRPNVVPIDDKMKPDAPGMAAKIKAAQALIAEPYPGMEWDEWLRRMLEDLFVLDAPVAYVRKNMGGGLFGIKPMHGATFNRVLDPWGDTPTAPDAAYVQILRGVGAVHYSADQIIYRPRNPRNGRAFGFGPVEQIITIINIGLRRETFQLNFFTEGNMPDALIGVPMEWTPDQIRNFQDWFDARLSGDLGKRRGATFVPGDVSKGYVATKETELFGAAEEWLARVVCFAFSTSPQPFVKMMNRATAGTAQEQAQIEGLEPLKDWVSRFWNYVFRVHCGWDDIKLDWHEDDDTDPKTQAETQGVLVDKGIKTRNEARQVLGLDSSSEPEADVLMVTTAGGATPLSFDTQLDQAQAKQDILPPPVAPGGSEPSPKPSSGAGFRPEASGAGGKGGAKEGPAGKVGSASPLHVHKMVRPDPVPTDRPATRKATRAIRRGVAPVLRAAGSDLAGQVTAALDAALKVAKADEPENKDGSGSAGEVGLSATQVNHLVDGLDLSSLDALVDVVDPALYDVAADSALKALAQVGVKAAADIVNRVNEQAVAFAKARAAELVGKRWTAAGDLIDNPSAKWAITETTRDGLRDLIAKGLEDNIGTPAIADSIESSFMFSAERADLIARTEVSNANSQGKIDGWREARESAGVVMQKGWQTTNDDNCCDDCQDNEAEGLIPLDDDFPSGDDAEPAHPNCQCVTYVEIEEGTEDVD